MLWSARAVAKSRCMSTGISIQEAVKQAKFMNTSCRDETIQVAMRLNVDPRKPNQSVRGSVCLPHGLGKKISVAVFATGKAAQDARSAGADFVGAEDLAQSITEGNVNFDRCIATPDMLGVVGRVARILGPRGLMPNVKLGTVCKDVASAIKSAKQGQVEFRAEKMGIVHAPLAKTSFSLEHIEDNLNELIRAIQDAKPSGAKGNYIRGATLTSNRGHAVPLDVSVKPFTMRKTSNR